MLRVGVELYVVPFRSISDDDLDENFTDLWCLYSSPIKCIRIFNTDDYDFVNQTTFIEGDYQACGKTLYRLSQSPYSHDAGANINYGSNQSNDHNEDNNDNYICTVCILFISSSLV